jgi:hypothetical protein
LVEEAGEVEAGEDDEDTEEAGSSTSTESHRL